MLEDLTETIAAKVGSLERSVDRIEEKFATKADVKAVYLEARQARRLLEQHMLSCREEARAAALRQDAIMSMLGDIVGRLPATSSTQPSAPSPTVVPGKPSKT